MKRASATTENPCNSDGSRGTKRARGKAKARPQRDPLCYDDAWGLFSDDVDSCVDWAAFFEAFDQLTRPTLWSLNVTHCEVSRQLPLRLKQHGQQHRRCSLITAVSGERVVSDSSEAFASLAESQNEWPQFIISSSVSLRDDANGKGRGWFVEQSLPAGTIILVERPVVAILDAEWRNRRWADCGSADTAALGIQLARNLSQSVEAVMKMMHPQEECAEIALADDVSDEDEDEAAALAVAVDKAWSTVEGMSDKSKARLRSVVRLNSLGFYTYSDLLCHSANFTGFTGSGLFALGSGFNHSCEPNVSRHSIGDMTIFVTNCPLESGMELCISYIENELLCAPKSLRSQSLNRDFICGCPKCVRSLPEHEREFRSSPSGERLRFMRVDAQVQANLAVLPAEDRVNAVEAALRGEMGDDDDEGEEEEQLTENDVEDMMRGSSELACKSKVPTILLGKDAQELRVVQALALMQMQRHKDALAVWRRLAAFSCHHCPPFDESVAVFATQCALCALVCGDAAAQTYVTTALHAHRVSCGASIYKHRYSKEVELSTVSADVKQQFWDLVGTGEIAMISWEDAVAAWMFTSDEVPEAYSRLEV